MNQEKNIHRYLDKYLNKGYSKAILRETLIKFHYSKQLVDKAFKEYEQEHFPLWYSLTFIAILIIIASVFLIFSPIDCDYDKQCFIENAINNKHVVVKEDIAGSTLQYTAKNNKLTKEFIRFADDEPQEAIDILKNKKIECNYNKFNPELVNNVFSGMESCKGDLLDLIYELEIIWTDTTV